jgi:hypothetical protein
MRTYLLIMGCAQTSESIIPTSHIPIERLYPNENHQLMEVPPIPKITVSPPPTYVKSVLKKTPSDERGKTERLPFLNRKWPSIIKSVNFDEQVLVKARTPTPNKIWYEKPSSTMPMRIHPRNDDDDDDYDDDEEIESVLSNEEQQNNQLIDTESQIPTLGPPTLLLQRNQPNNFWHKSNTMIENQSFSSTVQQPSYHINTYATDEPIALPANRIKVRRKLPDLGPPLIAPTPSYRPRLRSSIVSPYQSPTQFSIVSPYQSTVRSSIHPSYRSPFLPLTVSPYQSLAQPSSQTFHVQQTLPNTNVISNEYRTTVTNHIGESSPQTASYVFNPHPIENVT